MINLIKRIFGSRTLDEALDRTRAVKVAGVRFIIKKIDVVDYLNGSKVMLKIFDTYQKGKVKIPPESVNKTKEIYRDIIMAGVVKPVLSRKSDTDAVCVDELFLNWPIAHQLVDEIVGFTFQKKKS